MADNILELISKVDEFLEMHEKFEDDDLDAALGKIVKIIMKPDIPPQATVELIVQLQAISSKLYIQASWLKNAVKPKAGSIDYERKNMYYSISQAISDLCAALKYNVRGFSG